MKKILSIALLSVFLLFGCQTNEMDEPSRSDKKVVLSPQELLSIKYENSPELNRTELFDLVEAFQSNELKGNNNTRGLSQPFSYNIKSKYYLNENNTTRSNSKTRSIENTEEQIPVYEIDFYSNEDKGMAIVSGDRRAPHILAYIDKIKEEDKTLSAGPNALLQWAEMYLRNEVRRFDAIKDSLYTSAISKVSKELHITSQKINYEDIKDKIAIESPSSRSTAVEEIPSNLKVLTAVFPMCPSAWDQWEPYNCQLPVGNCEKFFPGWVEESHYPTGSGAVTVAHLMACIEPSITAYGVAINWAYLTENKGIKAPDYFNAGDPIEKRNMVGYLFKEIYNKTNTHAVTNSSGTVTGVTCSVSDIEKYLKSIFNCSKSTSWNINTVKNSLKAARPVYVHGKPDNKASDGVYPFILDGIKECYGRIDNVPYDINVNYIHANFGFGGGSQDGYYLMDIEKTTITFETKIPLIFKDNALTIIPDIRKK